LPPHPRPRAYPIHILNPQRRNQPSLEPKFRGVLARIHRTPPCTYLSCTFTFAFVAHSTCILAFLASKFLCPSRIRRVSLPQTWGREYLFSPSSSFPPGTIPLPCARTDPSPISSFRRTLWSYHMLDERPQRVRLCHTTSGKAMSGEISCPLNLLARSSSKLEGSSIQKLVTRIPL
jgi:hypothetical protein